MLFQFGTVCVESTYSLHVNWNNPMADCWRATKFHDASLNIEKENEIKEIVQPVRQTLSYFGWDHIISFTSSKKKLILSK